MKISSLRPKSTISNLLVVTLLLATICSCTSTRQSKPSRFIIAAHTYYTLRYGDLFFEYTDAISKEEGIDAVFFLGDHVCVNNQNEWDKFFKGVSTIQASKYYSPGNHDIYKFPYIEKNATVEPYERWKQEYISRIGYDYKVFSDDNANFILINSNDPIEKIGAFFKEIDSTLENGKLNILMTHHHIWDHYLQTSWKNWYFKRFNWQQIKPYLNKIDHIIAGDAWNNTPSTIDLDDGKKGYRVGIGGPGYPIYYAIVEVNGQNIDYEIKTLDLPEDHIYYEDAKRKW